MVWFCSWLLMILIKISLIDELMSMTDDHPLLVFVQNSLVALFLYRRSVNTIVCLLIVTRGRDSEGQGALIEVRIILTKNFTFLFQTSVNTIILRLFIYKIGTNCFQRLFFFILHSLDEDFAESKNLREQIVYASVMIHLLLRNLRYICTPRLP